MEAIEITGIWLIRRGGESNPRATVEVHVQIDGLWRHVITEPISANFSHEVSSAGIKNSPPSNWG